MAVDQAVAIETGEVALAADVVVPDGAKAVVLFAHGSGSSRHSPRNRMVAERLHEQQFATVLTDLLTDREAQYDAQTAGLRFDIDLLAERMTTVVEWAAGTEPIRRLPIGVFGASTGAAAALVTAAARPSLVRAVVSRGGRPDLAQDVLAGVRAPTLLIVGERDPVVIDLNKRAAAALSAPHRIHIVPGATHLFQEPGTLSEVADQAADWFAEHL